MRGSFRFQLILLFIIIGIVPLIAVASISYFVYYGNILNLTIDTATYNVDWVVKNINRYFQNVERIITMGEAESVNRFLRDEKNTPADSWDILSQYEHYRRSIFDEDSIQDITIIGLNGKCQSERDGYYRIDKDTIRTDPLISAILNSSMNSAQLNPAQKVTYRKKNSNFKTMLLGQILLDSTTLDVLGVIIIDIDPEKIKDYYLEVEGDIIGQMELVYNPEAKKEYTDLSPFNISSLRQGLAFFQAIQYKGWYLSYKISYEELIEPVQGVLQNTLVILFLSIVLIVFIFFFISRKIIAPLNLLRGRMEEAAQGDFSARLDIVTKDRVIAELGKSFNTMVYDLENLMKQKDEEHKNYLQAHFRVLQQQINPHFLYNTLDAIIWMTLEKRNDDVVHLVESLSMFFRLNLSKGEEVISIPDAVLSIENYLSIQKIRYADSLEYKIDISDTLRKGKVLKLIFQPIIENAIYHGIKERGHGVVTFSGVREGDTALFTVHDNGVGIGRDSLQGLVDSLEDPLLKKGEIDSNSKGFGLKNVQSRIKLFYGAEYGLTVDSTKGRGCTVEIKIPWMDE